MATTVGTSNHKTTQYETSPLSRPTQVTNEDTTTVSTTYGTNTAADNVLIFSSGSTTSSFSGGGGASMVSTTSSSAYPAGTLYKTVTKDENGNQTCSFTDVLGRTILSRKSHNSANVDAYHIYDDYGQQAKVIPPGAINSNVVDDNLTFTYLYDNKNGLSAKKIPGADWQYFYYDNRDLMVLSQDGNMKASSATKYLGLCLFFTAPAQ